MLPAMGQASPVLPLEHKPVPHGDPRLRRHSMPPEEASSRCNTKSALALLPPSTSDCNSAIYGTRFVVHKHLLTRGFHESFIQGEDFDDDEEEDNEGVGATTDGAAVKYLLTSLIKGAIRGHIVSTDEEPNERAKKFFNLLNEAEKELYPGCKEATKISFIVRLFQLKCMYGFSNSGIGAVLDLFSAVLPEGHCVPDTLDKVRKVVRDLGLDYQKIHACVNDCVLYRKDYEEMDKCPVCGESRWKTTPSDDNDEEISGGSAKKRAPRKILRYFPLTPWLERLYMRELTSLEMRWHKEGLVRDGKLRHPADSMAWKHVDNLYPDFASDPRHTNFTLRAYLLWTINDFPAYGMLSGWSTKANHKWRRNKTSFNNRAENRAAPVPLSGAQVLQQYESFEQVQFGKMSNKRKQREEETRWHNWRKKSIFFELPYWENLLVRHNLDVMHIEKNICDSILETLLDIEGKTKDNVKARLDMQHLGIRKDQHPLVQNGKYSLPPSKYSLGKEEKTYLCKLLEGVKMPDGYASNIKRCVNVKECKVSGLKTHDCHVIFQKLLPIAVRDILPDDVVMPLIELSRFFNAICSKELSVDDLDSMNNSIAVTLCRLEMVFPPAFFDIMMHLPVHLAEEAKLAGPVCYRWMYPIEGYLRTLKGYVRNKSHPEGTAVAEPPSGLSIFGKIDYRKRGVSIETLLEMDMQQIRHYLLTNCDEATTWVKEHKDELAKIDHRNVAKRHRAQFVGCVIGMMCRLRIEIKVQATKKDKYGIIDIDTTRLRYIEDPYIMGTQAELVFYVKFPKIPVWSTVVRIKPRNLFAMPEAPEGDNGGQMDLDSLDMGVEDMNVPYTDENPTTWIRSDMEGLSIDVSVIEKAHAECQAEEPRDLEVDNFDEDDDTYIDDGHEDNTSSEEEDTSSEEEDEEVCKLEEDNKQLNDDTDTLWEDRKKLLELEQENKVLTTRVGNLELKVHDNKEITAKLQQDVRIANWRVDVLLKHFLKIAKSLFLSYCY
ncbi:hypothetical protein U9M48_008718 [Paspalum notatum var. saurae]|uniref:Uncharacterized protein n=1 Tax=Paspalum notatum var. saurae TaxID=547442 RepID=A0AAQ3SQT1_PASNO